MNATDNASAEQRELNFIELLKVLNAYRWVLVGVTAACVVGAGVFAYISTPVYRAEALIAAADDSAAAGGNISSLISRFSALPGLSGFSRLARRDALSEGMVTLRSPQFLIEYINDNDLMPVLFAPLWDAENEEWLVDDPAEIPSEEDAYLLFREKLLSITEDEVNANIVSVAIEWRNREQAAQWTNDLIVRLNERLRAKAIEEADKTIDYLNKEVEKTRIVELRQAIYFMIENQINLRTMANVRDEYAFKVISYAVPPDEDRFVKPNRPFIIVIGVIVGIALGLFLSFMLFAIKRIRTELD